MLLVKTTLRQSSVHGLGVFAAEFIPAGTVVWCFQPDFDFRVSEESVAALPEIARDKMLHYSAKWGGGYVISADDARFINHSSGAANLRTLEDPDVDIATRDIQAGEELLEDYREFDDTFAGGTADDQIDPAVVDEIRRRIDASGLTNEAYIAAFNALTPEQITTAMETLPADALEFGVRFEGAARMPRCKGKCGDIECEEAAARYRAEQGKEGRS